MPKGGPDGGDGGDGGSIYFHGDSNQNTLIQFRHVPKIFSEPGQHGRGNNCSGKKGKDLHVHVPVGTVVKDGTTMEVLHEVVEEGQIVLVAKGGKGGRGNQHFATPSNQSPRHTEPGEETEEFEVFLELKLMADVGLVGFPNAGKSSLIAALSKATPKIADYPFTTLIPILGVIPLPEFRTMVMADIPGIIEGASTGKGLGIQFLKHVERTKILLIMLDISPYAEIDAFEAFNTIQNEMRLFGHGLSEKQFLIALNKSDLDHKGENAEIFKSMLPEYLHEKIICISGVTREGLEQLVHRLDKMMHQSEEETI